MALDIIRAEVPEPEPGEEKREKLVAAETPSKGAEEVPQLPDLKDIDRLIEEAEQIVSNETASLEHLLNVRQETLDKLRTLYEKRRKEIEAAESYTPFTAESRLDYQFLAQEGILPTEVAEKAQVLRDKIEKLENFPVQTPEIKQKLSELRARLEDIQKVADSGITEQQRKLNERRQTIIQQIFEKYSGELKELEDLMKEIEENEGVLAKLYDAALAIEAAEGKYQETVRFLKRAIQSLRDQQTSALKWIAKATGETDIRGVLNRVMVIKKGLERSRPSFRRKKLSQEFRRALDQRVGELKQALLKAVREGKVTLRDILPWERDERYYRNLEVARRLSFEELQALARGAADGDHRVLRRLEEVRGLFEEIQSILKIHGALWLLAGPRWLDKEKKVPGELWRAALEQQERK